MARLVFLGWGFVLLLLIACLVWVYHTPRSSECVISHSYKRMSSVDRTQPSALQAVANTQATVPVESGFSTPRESEVPTPKDLETHLLTQSYRTLISQPPTRFHYPLDLWLREAWHDLSGLDTKGVTALETTVDSVGVHGYRIPSSLGAESTRPVWQTVHLIYGLWDTTPLPAHAQRTRELWQQQGFTVQLWQKPECEALLQRYPRWERVARLCPRKVMVADLVRYLILWDQGGVYMDLDCIPQHPDLFALLQRDTSQVDSSFSPGSITPQVSNTPPGSHRTTTSPFTHPLNPTHHASLRLASTPPFQTGQVWVSVELEFPVGYQDPTARTCPLRQGIPELPLRIANYFLAAEKPHHVFLASILLVLEHRCLERLGGPRSRLSGLVAPVSDPAARWSDPPGVSLPWATPPPSLIDYEVLFLTGPDCVTETLSYMNPASCHITALAHPYYVRHLATGTWR